MWLFCICVCCFFFFKQKTAYEMRISDWSSDVCSSDLFHGRTHSMVSGGRMAHRFREWYRQNRVLILAAWISVAVLVIALLSGCRDTGDNRPEIGRASCRERVCQYV